MLCCGEKANATIPALGSARRDCGGSYAMLNGRPHPRCGQNPRSFCIPYGTTAPTFIYLLSMSMFTSISLIAISDQKQGQHKLCFLVRGVSMWARAWCWVVLVTPGCKLGLRGPKHKAKVWSRRVRARGDGTPDSIHCVHASIATVIVGSRTRAHPCQTDGRRAWQKPTDSLS
jgi:hypothetical protein